MTETETTLVVGRWKYDTTKIKGGKPCENAVRHMFQKTFGHTLKPTGRGSFWDFEGDGFVVEVKRRFESINRRPDYLVECRKFDDIERERKRSGFTKPTIFVVVFNDAIVAHQIGAPDEYDFRPDGIFNPVDRCRVTGGLLKYDAYAFPTSTFVNLTDFMKDYNGN